MVGVSSIDAGGSTPEVTSLSGVLRAVIEIPAVGTFLNAGARGGVAQDGG
jgi:hypothetical protein